MADSVICSRSWPSTISHRTNRSPILLKYDSTYGRFDANICASKDGISVDGKELRVFEAKDPASIPWGEVGVELVIESTGRFTDAEKAQRSSQFRRRRR